MTATESYDVVILGAGVGGMTAAAVAAIEGLRPVILEKTQYVGGTTAISGGMVWAPNSRHAGPDDSPAAAAAYLDATVPTEGGSDLRRAFLASAPTVIAYLHQHTAVRLQPVPLYPDYYQDAPGATTRGRVLEPVAFDGSELGSAFDLVRPPLPEFTLFGAMMVARPDIVHFRSVFRSFRSAARVARLVSEYAAQRLRHRRGTHLVLGNALVGRLLKSVLDRGVPIRRSAEVLRLEQAAGRISGVVLREGDGERLIEVRRAVVLATGGFSHNRSLRERFLPALAVPLSAAVDCSTGDGLALGVKAGGRLSKGELGGAYWTPASQYRDRHGRHVVYPHTVTDRGKPGVIAVDGNGRRFTSEAVSYHEFVRAMLGADETGAAVPAWLICDRHFVWKYGLGAIRPMTLRLAPYKSVGYLTEAPTIGDLARAIAVDADGLEATVARHNRDALAGVDSEFDRGGNVYQRFLGDAGQQPNPCLAPIEAPPYYAIALFPADLGTACGLVTNADAQVLDQAGAPIPGLYACGNDMNAIMRGAYPGPGITIGPAITFAYLAAMHAASAEPG